MSVSAIKTKSEFDQLLKENPKVVVDFTATWCGPCQMIKPKFQAMASEFSTVKFVQVDVDEAAEIAESCGISAMPTFHMYKDGTKADELVGASEEKLRQKIQNLAQM